MDGLPNRASSQVVSPTILSKSAVRRLRLCCYRREEQALGRLTTLARTSRLRLLRLKWMKDEIWESQERKVNATPFRTYHSKKENSESRSSHVPTNTERPEARGDALTQEKVKSTFTDFLELRADHAAQGENAALSKLSEAYHTRLLLEEQKNHTLSDARSELHMQELRVESADRALLEIRPTASQRIKLYQAKQLSDQSRREKDWLCTELEERELKELV